MLAFTLQFLTSLDLTPIGGFTIVELRPEMGVMVMEEMVMEVEIAINWLMTQPSEIL